jgi:hypothetical protein
MRLDKLASPSALGFIAAATPSAIPETAAGVTAAAVAIASAAILFIYSIYEHYEEKKHAEAIKLIEGLHQEELAKISIPECNIVTGFPPIFQKDSEGKYNAMTMTDAQVSRIASDALRTPTDINLVAYRHHIIRAIEALKKYYFLHQEKTGLTVQVILYLINVLEKLLEFQGYAFDIAYINKLCNFICKYASSKGKQSEHFTCLNPVFRHLQYAMQKLIAHKETRSQEEMIGELRGTCMFYIDKSIRALTKFAVPHTEWRDIDTADPYQLRDGIYSSEYIKRYSITHWTHEKKSLPQECQLSNIISKLTYYFLETLDCKKQPYIPVWQISILSELPEDALINIHAIFEAEPEKNPHKPIHDPETIQLMETLSQFAKLIHYMISFLYFLNELTKMIKNIGSAEADNPERCKRIYALHEILSDQIRIQAEIIEKAFIAINRQNNNQMRIAEKECFLRDLLQMIKEIKLTIDSQSDAIHERRIALEKKYGEALNNAIARENMAEVVKQIEMVYNIKIPSRMSFTPASLPIFTTTPTPTPASQPISPPTNSPEKNIKIPANLRVSKQPTPKQHHANATPRPLIAPKCPIKQNSTIIHYPKSYETMYATAKTKSIHKNLPLLHLIIIMMNDYTKNNSTVSRILHGSFFHHHVDEANTFSENFTKKISTLTNNSDATTRSLLLEALQKLITHANKPATNKAGSFAMRVKFIRDKCKEQGVELHVPLKNNASTAAAAAAG